jgi:hypothetical protein
VLLRLFAIPFLCMVAGASFAQQGAAALRAKHAELQSALASNQFQRPLYLLSTESADSVSGNIYAVIRQPFASAAAALENPAAWCEILFLHQNTKYCRPSPDAKNPKLNVVIGKKFDQPLEDAFRVDFAFAAPVKSADYLQVALNADKGPLSTRNYRITFEAVPLDASRTFIHLAYAYDFGMAGKLAMQLYLGTAGSDKVGFTVVGKQSDGTPQYVGGMRGVVERNTMRYYLAIDSHLGALSAPPQSRIDKMLRDWYAATERYALQLHEMEQAEYLAMKRREYQRQS